MNGPILHVQKLLLVHENIILLKYKVLAPRFRFSVVYILKLFSTLNVKRNKHVKSMYKQDS